LESTAAGRGGDRSRPGWRESAARAGGGSIPRAWLGCSGKQRRRWIFRRRGGRRRGVRGFPFCLAGRTVGGHRRCGSRSPSLWQ